MSPPRKVVLASGNAGKLKEFQTLLGEQLTLVPQSELAIEAAEETGTTFAENALLKARHAADRSGLPAIADDSGLVVDALDGAPGVYSARYAGHDSDAAANNAKLLRVLDGVPAGRRGARFRAVVVYVASATDVNPLIAEGVWEGSIATEARGQNGFGYDPLFIDADTGEVSAELSPAQKNRRSHRGQAARELRKKLDKTIGR
jgi:XTP/dITP diphosphohydrolase